MIVKICGITNREDAVAAAEAGAGILGFNFYPQSPRYVTPEAAAQLHAGLDIETAGIFVNESSDAIAAIVKTARLDIAQLYDTVPCPGIRVWRACRIASPDFELPVDPDAEAFLLDGFSPEVLGGSGVTFDWSLARDLGKRIVLAGGLDAANVRRAIHEAHPWAVDACSRIESSPGRKDHDKMRQFIEAARSAVRHSNAI